MAMVHPYLDTPGNRRRFGCYIFCGDEVIEKNQLFAAFRAIECYNRSNSYATLDIPTVLVRRLDTHFQFSRLDKSARMTRFELLDMARLSMASDPRDMVYALLGHPVFGQDSDGNFIDIDYFLTREEIYFAIASQLLLEAEYPSQLLSLVKHTDANFHEREMLMSWIPEWDVKSNLKTLGCHMTNLLACGRSRQEYTTMAEGLYIQGVYVDHIVWQSDVLTAEDFPEFILRTSELPDSLRNTLKKLLPFLPDGASNNFCAKLCRTLTTTQGECAFSMTEMRNIKTYLRMGLTRTGNLNPATEKPGVYCGPTLQRFNRYGRKWAEGRRLFMTQKGQLGLGPPVSREGDSVCVFLGAQVPFITRGRAGPNRGLFRSFYLCGECYVDEIMQGEVIQLVKEGKAQKQKFHLV